MQLTEYDREMLGLTRTPSDAPDFIVNVVDIASSLDVHPRTVQRWILAGKVPAHRMGAIRSRWRVRLGDLDRAFWVADRTKDRRMLTAMIRAGLRGMQ